jgi:excisionase family DNA binding protein
MPPYLQAEQTKRLLSADELARELGVGRTTAYTLLWSRAIPSMKLGRLRKVRREDLEAYLAERMKSAL